MSSAISYKDRDIWASNMQFSSLIDFAVEIAKQTAKSPEEQRFVARMAEMQESTFWPGRGMEIENDFPALEEQKFWARVFLDTARAIFDRRIGIHEHSFWQASQIHNAFAAGRLFVQAVRDRESGWEPDTQDSLDFDRVVNKRT